MRQKEIITEANYKEKTLKRGVIACWILLAICAVIKAFGGNFFDMICNSEKFVKFCTYCDTSFIKYIIYFMYFMLESTVYALILRPNTTIKDNRLWLYCVCCSLFWVVKVLYEFGILDVNVTIANIIPLVILYLLLLGFSKRPVMSLLIIIYQTILALISSFIKDISLSGTLSDSALFTFIFYIDYYIVFIMTMLYSKIKYIKKEGYRNGIN